jgi:hypothetical protein
LDDACSFLWNLIIPFFDVIKIILPTLLSTTTHVIDEDMKRLWRLLFLPSFLFSLSSISPSIFMQELEEKTIVAVHNSL